ncbi:Protein of unknown function DUF3339 - like 6, partial [Theobroma cacao]
NVHLFTFQFVLEEKFSNIQNLGFKSELKKERGKERKREMSADWGPVIVAVVLFILLSPGLLFQLPSRTRVIEFGNMCTSGIAILVHAVIYFCIVTILIIAIGIHIHCRQRHHLQNQEKTQKPDFPYYLKIRQLSRALYSSVQAK